MMRNALGKGLSALIREPETEPEVKASPKHETNPGQEAIQLIDIDRIEPSPVQPRVQFANEALEDLAASIRVSGVIQPLLLMPAGDKFHIVAGERRWRAAQRAELKKVPAVVRQLTRQQALEIALVENLQREDLNAIEQANAFSRLMQDFHFTQDQIAERTGKDRATIANALRLLKLEPPIQEMVIKGSISAGHAKALLAFSNSAARMKHAKRAAAGLLTVRQLEAAAGEKHSLKRAAKDELDPNTRAAIEELQRILGTKVILRPRIGKRAGILSIEYYEDAELARLYDRLAGQ